MRSIVSSSAACGAAWEFRIDIPMNAVYWPPGADPRGHEINLCRKFINGPFKGKPLLSSSCVNVILAARTEESTNQIIKASPPATQTIIFGSGPVYGDPWENVWWKTTTMMTTTARRGAGSRITRDRRA